MPVPGKLVVQDRGALLERKEEEAFESVPEKTGGFTVVTGM